MVATVEDAAAAGVIGAEDILVLTLENMIR